MKTTVLALFGFTSFAIAGTPISFRQLPLGNTLQVTFKSSGCFHSVSYEFEIQRVTTTTAKVTRIEDRWNEGTRKREVAKRIPLGTTTLTDAELAGLDRLVVFYRSMRGGGCTTQDQITLKQIEGNTTLATESYTDGTCATYSMRDITTLSAIAKKVEPKTK